MMRETHSTMLIIGVIFLITLTDLISAEGGIAALKAITGNRPYGGFGNAPAEGVFGPEPAFMHSQDSWQPGTGGSIGARPSVSVGSQWNQPFFGSSGNKKGSKHLIGSGTGFGGRWQRPQSGWDYDMSDFDGRTGGPSPLLALGSSSHPALPPPTPSISGNSGGGGRFYKGRGNAFINQN